jgi:septal ring factor EnvC (AmiA/AmiB activator)
LHTTTRSHTHHSPAHPFPQSTYQHFDQPNQIRRLRDTESELSAELKRIELRMAAVSTSADELSRLTEALHTTQKELSYTSNTREKFKEEDLARRRRRINSKLVDD